MLLAIAYVHVLYSLHYNEGYICVGVADSIVEIH